MVSLLSHEPGKAGRLFRFADQPVAGWIGRLRFRDPGEVDEATLARLAGNGKADPAAGYAIDPATLPRQAVWPVDDLAQRDVLPGFIVSAQLRDFIERWDPGVHQFVPVEVRRDKGGPAVGAFFWFIVCRRLASVDPDRTSYAWNPQCGGYWTNTVADTQYPDRLVPVPEARLVFSEARAQGAAVWHDPTIPGAGNRLCSARFAAAARAEHFTGLAIEDLATA